jgi:hypothetical protein
VPVPAAPRALKGWMSHRESQGLRLSPGRPLHPPRAPGPAESMGAD